jgi:hypothetical protein
MNSIVQLLVKHGYSVLFASVFARQLCLPVPAILFLIAAGALAGCVDEPRASTAFLPSVAPRHLCAPPRLCQKSLSLRPFSLPPALDKCRLISTIFDTPVGGFAGVNGFNSLLGYQAM